MTSVEDTYRLARLRWPLSDKEYANAYFADCAAYVKEIERHMITEDDADECAALDGQPPVSIAKSRLADPRVWATFRHMNNVSPQSWVRYSHDLERLGMWNGTFNVMCPDGKWRRLTPLQMGEEERHAVQRD